MNQISSNQEDGLSHVIAVAQSKRIEGFSKLHTARHIFPDIQHLPSKVIIHTFMEGCALKKTTATSYRFMIKRENTKALQRMYENEDKGIGSA